MALVGPDRPQGQVLAAGVEGENNASFVVCLAALSRAYDRSAKKNSGMLVRMATRDKGRDLPQGRLLGWMS
jgi:hypothetical protein